MTRGWKKIDLRFIPWYLRGYDGPVWQLYLEISDSHDLSQLVEVRRALRSPPVVGLVLAENRSRALLRLGWEKIDEGLYGKIFP